MSNFKLMSTEELIVYCKKFNWTRKPREFHIHHTWKPSHKDYNGQNGIQLQENMRNYHVKNLKWLDIGQHLTLLPDGKWVTGRNFNCNPASIYGRNQFGFAIEMLGNFDINFDLLQGEQLKSIVEFLSFGLNFFKLDYRNIIFHREYAPKTCPGTSINKDWFINQIKQYNENNANLKTISVVENSIRLKYNNQLINVDNYIYKGTTYVPLRFLTELFNKKIDWDNETKTINILD